MLRIQLFGHPTVVSEQGPAEGKAVQRHRLALLSLLACAPDRTLSRDKLVAMLWPDSGQEDARHLLNTALHAIRRQFGESVVISRQDAVSLSAGIHVDVTDFDTALDQGNPNQAVMLYRAPFLDGFTLGDAFDKWMVGERSRLAGEYQSALEALADATEAAGDLRSATAWWRAAVAENPLSTRLTMRLMRVLERTGDREDAIRTGDEHVALLGRHLAAEPVDEFRRLIRRLREEPGPAIAGSGEASPVPDATQAAWFRRRTAWVAAALLVVMSALVVLATRQDTRTGPGTDATSERIAVLPFLVRGTTDSMDIGHGISDLLTTGLDLPGVLLALESGAVHAALRQVRDTSAAATRRQVATALGIDRVVTGEVVHAGDQVRMTAVVWNVPASGRDSAVATISVEGAERDLFRLLDELSAGVLAASARGADRLERIALRTTDSLEALKLFLSGSREYRRGEYAQAAAHFERATEIDSLFSLAWFRLATSAEWSVQYDRARRAAAKAVALSERLAPTERLMAEALDHYLTGSTREAERMLEQVVALRPEDSEAWFRLAEIQFHCYAYRDRPMEDSRQAWRNVLGRDSVHTGALLHLARLALLEQDSAAVDKLVQRVRLVSPRADRLDEARTMQAFIGGREAAERAILRELTAAGDSALLSSLQGLTAFSDHVDGGRSIALALRYSFQQEMRKLALIRLAELEMAGGRPEAADRWLVELGALDADLSRIHRAYFATLPGIAAPRARIDSLLAASLTTVPPRAVAAASAIGPFSTLPAVLPELHLYTTGRLAASLGRWADVSDASAQLRGLGGPTIAARLANDFALSLDASTLLARGDTTGGERLLRLATIETPVELLNSSWFYSQSAEQWLRAELAERSGRDDIALNTFAAARHSRIFAAPASLAMAEIHERRGYRSGAIREFRRVLRLLQAPESAAAILADSARQRLHALGVGNSPAPARPR